MIDYRALRRGGETACAASTDGGETLFLDLQVVDDALDALGLPCELFGAGLLLRGFHNAVKLNSVIRVNVHPGEVRGLVGDELRHDSGSASHGRLSCLCDGGGLMLHVRDPVPAAPGTLRSVWRRAES